MNDDDRQELDLLHRSYREVLEATKHEDAKVGRFLAAIAFLVAGALAFVSPDVLQARYRVGDSTLALPAILMGLFLGLTVLAVLLLILAIGRPLTLPSPARGEVTGARRGSRIFFGQIAEEANVEEWRGRWQPEQLREDYLDEIYHLARRTVNKRNRVVEGVAVFSAALLCFGVLVGLGVDISRRGLPHELGLALRVTLAVGACIYAGSLLYHALRTYQVRRLRASDDDKRMSWGYRLLCTGLWAVVIATVVSTGWVGNGRWIMAALASIGTTLAFAGAWLLIQHGVTRTMTVSFTAVLGGFAIVSIVLSWAPVLLLIALIATLSPLLTQVVRSLTETNRWRNTRRSGGDAQSAGDATTSGTVEA